MATRSYARWPTDENTMLASEELGMRNSSEYRLEMIDDEDDEEEDYETVLLHPL